MFLKLRHFLSAHSSFYNLVSHIKARTKKSNEKAADKYIEILRPENEREIDFRYSIEFTNLIIKKMNDLLKEKGIKFVIVVLPTREHVSQDSLKELLDEYNISGINLDMEWSVRELYNIGKAYDIPILNLLPEIKEQNKNNSFYFDNDIHFTREGCEVVGELIYEQLLDKKLIN